jgi:pyruvate formate lyase activating enzyme
VDIKGFSDTAYQKLARVSRWRGILEVAKRAREKWRMHVEVVTNVTPGINDDDEQLSGIADWIAAELGELTPWHITRFYPHHLRTDIPPTPIVALEHAYDIGRKAGLKFIYLGNVPGHKSEATVCPACSRTVVERVGYETAVVGLDTSRCRFCGAGLNILSGTGEIMK